MADYGAFNDLSRWEYIPPLRSLGCVHRLRSLKIENSGSLPLKCIRTTLLRRFTLFLGPKYHPSKCPVLDLEFYYEKNYREQITTALSTCTYLSTLFTKSSN